MQPDLHRRQAGMAELVIADDHELARSGLRSMLTGERGLELVGEATNGREALDLCRRLKPDLALLDVRMPEMDGLAATRAIKQVCPSTSVIIVTMHETPEYLFDALKAGAAGYLLKDATLARADLGRATGAARRIDHGRRSGGAHAPAPGRRNARPSSTAPRSPDAARARGSASVSPWTNQPRDRQQAGGQRWYSRNSRRAYYRQARRLRPHPGGREGCSARAAANN